MHQSFTPDRRSGYVLPSTNDAKFKAYDLGIKLVSGSAYFLALYFVAMYRVGQKNGPV